MGGYNSGSYQSYDAKMLVEHTTWINIFDLHRSGFDLGKDGQCVGTSRNGFLVRMRSDGNMLTLEYRIGTQRHIQEVHITTTSPYFGGRRHWFSCPYCRRRCGVLYLIGTRFVCRICGNLAYQSTRIVPQSKLMQHIHAEIASFDRRMAERRARIDKLLAQDVGR